MPLFMVAPGYREAAWPAGRGPGLGGFAGKSTAMVAQTGRRNLAIRATLQGERT